MERKGCVLRGSLTHREGVHLRGEEAAHQKGRGKPKDLGKKAVLMNGPPGIGKTSSAMILTRSADSLVKKQTLAV